jgi:hypothetical protein
VSSMSRVLGVLLNGVAQLEYDRDKPLSDYQSAYLDEMDRKMDGGIQIGDAQLESPDQAQRNQYIAANLLHAMRSGNESMTSALCSYLASRIPDMKQLRYTEEDGKVSIEMVFDEAYRKQVAVGFQRLH